MQDVIIIFNRGSSSLKFSVYNKAESNQTVVLLKGEIEQNPEGAHFHVKNHEGISLAQESWTNTGLDIFDHLFGWLEQFSQQARVVAVGHRIVHGGAGFSAPVKITPTVLERLERLTPFDPLHQQATLAPAKAIAQKRPNLLQVACFDTMFHNTMPRLARILPLPGHYEGKGVVRYGFHGISYSYIAQRLKLIDPTLAQGKTIVAHLGSGASLCALKNSVSVETTMGFSALDGLMMGTRCGAIDPGVLLYMIQEEKADWSTLVQTLYHNSGLLGVSGVSSDMRVLRDLCYTTTDLNQSRKIKDALDLFVYRIIQEIGALTVVMRGIDGIVFTAGIGEHDAELRQEICQRLEWAGVIIDSEANRNNASIISMPESRVKIRIEPTDEELEIYRQVIKFFP